MEEPQLRLFMPDAVRPSPASLERTGVWLAEEGWPAPNATVRAFRPETNGSLAAADGAEVASGRRLVPQIQAVGLDSGPWCGYGGPLDNPSDQRGDDARSLVFDSEPLEVDLAVLGRPRAVLEVESDRPLAQMAVRLCDVWPDGASTLITRGMLNLAHRNGHEHPEPLSPGEPETVVVELDATGYRLPVGHRLRMSVSSGYWPMMWPSPEPVQLTVYTGGSTRLDLPVRLKPAGEADAPPEHFSRPEAASLLSHEDVSPRGSTSANRVTRDAGTACWQLETGSRDRHVRLSESGLEYAEQGRMTYRITEGRPLSATAISTQSHLIARGDWRIRVETRSTLSATKDDFVLSNELDAFEADQRVFSRVWRTRVPRDHT